MSVEVGARYGKLTVLVKAASKVSGGQTKVYCIVECDCGTVKEVRHSHLTQGRTRACGCVKPGNRTHGQSNTRLYDIWQCMKQRCYYERSKAYPYYGGRGVYMCRGWKDDFAPFFKWAMDNGYNNSLTIDRVNNSIVYSPDTCEWVTLQENIRRRDVCKAGGSI